MKLSELAAGLNPGSKHGPEECEISGIWYDSRRVEAGGLFVAVCGHHRDGTEYITEAVSRGAAAVISENDLDLGGAVAHLQVDDARLALAQVSARFYGEPAQGLHMVGITGTNGKTSTAYMLRRLLEAGGIQAGQLGTVSYELGKRSLPALRTTPEAPELHGMLHEMVDAGCRAAVMEVSSHALSLKRTAGMGFQSAVFTNLTRDHLDYHENMESYFEAKAELFRRQLDGADAAAVVNADDVWGRRLLQLLPEHQKVITYGFDPEAMVRAVNERIHAFGTVFRLESPWGTARIQLPMLGRYNVSNALAAIAVAGDAGVPVKVMRRALRRMPQVPGRLEAVANRERRHVYVDYAHTDDALEHVLATLREISKHRIVVVFGCGGNRDRSKREKMGRVAALGADYTVVTSDNPRDEDPADIAAEIARGFERPDQYEVVLDRRAAIARGLELTGRRDLLLIAGKGHENYQESGGVIVPFDDCETVKELLQ